MSWIRKKRKVGCEIKNGEEKESEEREKE